ncbi:MAG: right-handed parallel beta-helix repeat-containing protein [Alphaproteobacteria bacterium]|nr:right-handed parallel beta-helix repeat-containing protein [Alphaproteobacteria bacterium]
MTRFILLSTLAAAVGLLGVTAFGSGAAHAVTVCTYTDNGTTRSLDADCETETTIIIPDGMTLDGNGNSITAVDPGAGHFVGAIVTNGGTVAHVTRLVVNTSDLANVCDASGNRLRGIMFEGASGSITQNTVEDIHQGPSGCQEGNAIEVRNAPFDGTHPNTQNVEIAHNVVQDWQKSGIVCNGDVDCRIHHNVVSESFTQENLAPNSVQLGFGATGIVELNHIAGKQWLGASNFVATAILIFSADGVTIQRNNIGGNSDVGVYLFGEDAFVDNNRIFDGGPDGPHGDYGLFDFGATNVVTNNKIRGFDDPSNVDGQVVISGGPADPNPVCFGTSSDCGQAAAP